MISTLVKDINDRLVSNQPFSEDIVNNFGKQLSAKLASRLSQTREQLTLRLSNLGSACDRKLWYSINKPELSEPLPASARLKFLFGDILEELLLFLAKSSGHDVRDEQREVNLFGVRGHIDAVIDGELVDVKSASTYSFQKFRNHTLEQDDPFGYLTQLDGYLESLDNVNKTRAHFLAIDKQNGHIALDTHAKQIVDYEKLVTDKKEMLACPTAPARGYSDEPDGASGNRKLGVACSYCAFKSSCWPGLRAFSYSRRPVFLTRVLREPKVPELSLADAQEQ